MNIPVLCRIYTVSFRMKVINIALPFSSFTKTKLIKFLETSLQKYQPKKLLHSFFLQHCTYNSILNSLLHNHLVYVSRRQHHQLFSKVTSHFKLLCNLERIFIFQVIGRNFYVRDKLVSQLTNQAIKLSN